MTFTDLSLMLNFAVSVVTGIVSVINSNFLLQIPFIAFGVCIVLWILKHFIPTDIDGLGGKK